MGGWLLLVYYTSIIQRSIPQPPPNMGYLKCNSCTLTWCKLSFSSSSSFNLFASIILFHILFLTRVFVIRGCNGICHVFLFWRERGNILYINGSYLWAHLSKSWLSWAEWGYASAYLFCKCGWVQRQMCHKACWWKTLYTIPACFRLEKYHFSNYLKINFCAGVKMAKGTTHFHFGCTGK